MAKSKLPPGPSLFDLTSDDKSDVEVIDVTHAPDVTMPTRSAESVEVAVPTESRSAVATEPPPDVVPFDAPADTSAPSDPVKTMDTLPGLEQYFEIRSDLRGDVYKNDDIINDAFQWFREVGFPYKQMPLFVMKQQINALANTPRESLAATVEAYSVADVFHPHRFHVTVDGKVSPLQCFHDDVKFRHALYMRKVLRKEEIPAGFFGELTLSRGTQQCSNFRPGFACWMYRRYCDKHATVLDTSTGYGGRLVGFLASRLDGMYFGIDPNTQTHLANLEMAKVLGFADRVQLINAPAEDVDPHLFHEQCDFAFTSPPYFSKEHYSDEDTQSWKRYGHSFPAWVDGFLRPMLTLTFYSLKPDKTAVINIEDVKIRGKKHSLVDATIKTAVSLGFSYLGEETFKMQPRVGAYQEEAVATERVLIFVKPKS